MVSFTCGSYFARFPTRDINEFPEVKEMEHTNHATVSCQDFKEMTGQVSFATASDKQKPLSTGVLFEVDQYRFIMAATNTHRLAAKEITLPEEASAKGRFVVSGSILSDVVRLLPDEDGSTVEISWSKTMSPSPLAARTSLPAFSTVNIRITTASSRPIMMHS